MNDAEVRQALRCLNFYSVYSSGYHAALRNLVNSFERMPKVDIVSGCRVPRGEIILAIMKLLLMDRQVFDEHMEYGGDITGVWLRVEGKGRTRKVIAYKKGA